MDNSLGIHKIIKDKIINLFFTTRPSGKGLRLGYSLDYGIEKAQGGKWGWKKPKKRMNFNF